jgi:hypothetical protein
MTTITRPKQGHGRRSGRTLQLAIMVRPDVRARLDAVTAKAGITSTELIERFILGLDLHAPLAGLAPPRESA